MNFTYLSPYGSPQLQLGEQFTKIMSQLNFRLRLAGPVSPDFDPPVPVQRCQLSDENAQVVVQVVDSNGDPVNLRLSSSIMMKFLAPSGASYSESASFLTNGYDGKIVFSSTSTLPPFDEVGVWFVQVHVGSSPTTGLSTSQGKFYVQSNIP